MSTNSLTDACRKACSQCIDVLNPLPALPNPDDVRISAVPNLQIQGGNGDLVNCTCELSIRTETNLADHVAFFARDWRPLTRNIEASTRIRHEEETSHHSTDLEPGLTLRAQPRLTTSRRLQNQISVPDDAIRPAKFEGPPFKARSVVAGLVPDQLVLSTTARRTEPDVHAFDAR